MKQLLLGALLLTGAMAHGQGSPPAGMSLPAPAGSLSALDTKNGFRTYVLGTPVSDYPQLKRRGKDVYESPKESLMEADVRLNGLRFTSYQGRLASIAFGTQGADNIEKLLAMFTREYGPGTQVNAALQSWVGSKATLYVSRVGAGDYEIGLVTLKSNELAAQQKAATN